MAQIGIRIESTNFNGESVDITFNPFSGGSINLGTQTIPYDYLSTNYEGNYSIYIPSVPKTCELQVGTPPSPTPSPTSSVTPSVTPSITPTITPTASVTVTPTPSVTLTPTPSASVPSGDPDATAYLAAVVSAGGTTDATIDAAVDTFFTDLKAAGVYSKIAAMYPYIGGTSASHAINANLNTAYNLTFNGGWTFSSAGSDPNGINAYADTSYIIPASQDTDMSMGIYVTTSATTTPYALDSSITNYMQLAHYWNATNNSRWGYSNGGSVGTPITNDGENMIGTRRNSTQITLHQNGVGTTLGQSSTITGGSVYPIFWAAQNTGAGATFYSSKNQIFAFICNTALSNIECVDLSTAINDLQTSLGRNTY